MLEMIWKKWNPPTLLVDMYIGKVTMENCWSFLKKLKIELLYNPAIPLLSIYMEKMKILMQKMHTSKCSQKHFIIAKTRTGLPLVVQWLRLQAPNANHQGFIHGQGTRSHMPQLSLHAATKILDSQINKHFF